ncbi:hypothetical protein DFJ73DRAFT_756578 [Zopfochytrium polystomum]|nr:hypothetical protein DFJ73DRAFT_756578 [Zopfochytrium polystomum]
MSTDEIRNLPSAGTGKNNDHNLELNELRPSLILRTLPGYFAELKNPGMQTDMHPNSYWMASRRFQWSNCDTCTHNSYELRGIVRRAVKKNCGRCGGGKLVVLEDELVGRQPVRLTKDAEGGASKKSGPLRARAAVGCMGAGEHGGRVHRGGGINPKDICQLQLRNSSTAELSAVIKHVMNREREIEGERDNSKVPTSGVAWTNAAGVRSERSGCAILEDWVLGGGTWRGDNLAATQGKEQIALDLMDLVSAGPGAPDPAARIECSGIASAS